MGDDQGPEGLTERVRVAVVEDTIVREMLGAAMSGLDVVAKYIQVELLLDERPKVDLVVLDHQLADGKTPVLQGPKAIRALISAGYTRICMYTQETRPLPLAMCLVAGALGLARKQDAAGVSEAQFLRVARGEMVVADSFPGLAEFLDRRRAIRDLTDKQRYILHARARGIPWYTIARRLGIRQDTAEDDMPDIDRKVGAYLRALGADPASTPGDIERALGITPDDLMD